MNNDAVAQITGKWWTFLLRGIVALCLAAFAFAAPSAMTTALVYVFAAYFIISGIASLALGFSFTGVGHWWAFVFLGAVETALGILMLAQPGAGPLALAYLFALWLVTSGTLEIAGAVTLRDLISGTVWWALLGVISVAFGFYVLWRPDLGLLALDYVVGWYALFAGIALTVFAFRVKSVGAAIPTQRVAHP